MRDKIDLMWGLDQMERYLSEHHNAAENIMNICSEVQKQVADLIKQTKPEMCCAMCPSSDDVKRYSPHSSDSLNPGDGYVQLCKRCATESGHTDKDLLYTQNHPRPE